MPRIEPASDQPMAQGEPHDPSHEIPPFPQRYRKALADAQLGRNVLTFQRNWRERRDGMFAGYAANPLRPEVDAATVAHSHVPVPDVPGGAEFADLRARLRAIKDDMIARQDAVLDQLQQAAEARGIHVYRATDAAAANRYILELCQRHGIDHVVKSKTMVSEEIELNAALEPHGIQVVETDLGEWIQQLAHERPSHMIAPAIHKNRAQVAELFSEVTGHPVSHDDIGQQVTVARQELRKDFLAAGMGISGANAVITSTGTVMLVTNEGNGRLVTTLPRVHVALVGIEKLVPDFAAAMLQLRVLARSAAGQPISSYTTFISGPADPDKEMHIVLVDNGRSAMRADPLISEALRCIRCAACANVCPPYAVVGGHVFGYIYSGAIGLVNTPYHHGIEAAAGPQSLCVSCNACATVCPVEIPLPQQILAVRAKVADELGLPAPIQAALTLWAQPALADRALRAAALAAAPLRDGRFTRLSRLGLDLIPQVHRLTSWRTTPALPRRTGQDRLRRPRPQPRTLLPSQANGLRVAYFVQCITDRLFPGMALAIVRMLEACGVTVIVPKAQHCCGLPALDAGDLHHARVMARQTIETLEGVQADYILTGGTSCAVAMLHEYGPLFRHDPAWQARAHALAERVIDFTTFMDSVARLAPGALARPDLPTVPVTYHNFCQSANVLGIADAPRRLIQDVLGLELRELPEGSVCCGFGGSTSVRHPEVTERILARKLANVQTTGAPLLVTDNPGCILHLRGGVDAQGLPIQVVHLAELMAAHLPR